MLYEVDPKVAACISDDAINGERLAALQLDKATLIRNIALEVKNRRAEVDALREEERNFNERRKAMEQRAATLENYLAVYLNGERIKGKDFVINWRKSAAIIVQDADAVPEEYKVISVSVNKSKAMADYKAGLAIPGLAVEERLNMTVK